MACQFDSDPAHQKGGSIRSRLLFYSVFISSFRACIGLTRSSGLSFIFSEIIVAVIEAVFGGEPVCYVIRDIEAQGVP